MKRGINIKVDGENMTQKPAVLGGEPLFKDTVPIVRPPIKDHINSILIDYKRILESGMITNFQHVQKLEEAVASYIGVDNCIATASGTLGLMLALKALNLKDREVLIPSFTFPATAHAVHWNNLKIRLVDCNPKTLNVDTEDLKEKTTSGCKVLIPVHVFGNPCDMNAISEIAVDHDLKVIFDSAHAFGAMYKSVKVGQFGDAEVFSGSPTKAFTTVEGGLVTTNNREIAKKVEIGRNYGHYGDYNCEISGLSARMSELHAALGLNVLPHISSHIERRNEIAKIYREGLSKLSGIKFQEITPNSVSTYKDFAILIDESKFGLSRDELAVSLDKEKIMTRKYFYPPIHMQNCYPELKAGEEDFPNTTLIANNVLCLPMFSDLTDEQINKIIKAITRIHKYAEEIKIAKVR